QWLLSPRLWDPLKNLVVWQLGVPLGVAALIGVAVVGLSIVRRRPGEAALVELTLRLMLLSFVLTVFFYFGSKFAHTGRYPLPLDAPAQQYKGELLPVFDPDDSTKLTKLYRGLSVSRYYILSSPRAWRTVGRLPRRFPIMSRFYERLFDGRLGFVRAARFS